MAPTIQLIQDLAVVFLAAALGGLLCRRLGISPIVGYLIGGMLVGPSTPLRALITDPGRVSLLAQLGLVFLMFGIGLGFSLRRLQQLGLPLLGATALTAFLVFDASQLVGSLLGLEREAGIFFAGMLVVSSSAVIGKILTDSGRSHEKSSQLAFGITLSEDVVAIVILTILGGYTQLRGSEATAPPGVLPTLALFFGFLVVMGVVGLLVVPWLLRRLSREASTELENLFIAGVLLGVSLLVARAGYSLALGAFVLGAIIGETPQRAQVERAFGSLRDLFGSMFFVAIGMAVDVQTLPEAMTPLLVMTVLAILIRSLAATFSLLVLGYDGRTAWRAGLILTPIGEFSFIIAQMGINESILESRYLTAAIGASLVTALVSPLLVRHNVVIADRISSLRPAFLGRALDFHRRLLAALMQRRDASVLWKLLGRRLVQVGIEIVLVSTILVFAAPMISWATARMGPLRLGPLDTTVLCWIILGILLLAPLIAIWRNTQAVAMIVADYAGHQSRLLARARPLVETVLQGATLLTLALWLGNFVPADGGMWLTVGSLGVIMLVAAVFWRRFIRWHSRLEISFSESLADQDPIDQRSYAWMDRYTNWGLEIGEIALPDQFALAGQSIGEIGIRTKHGCSVVGIERQSFTIANPGAESRLFPGDRVLVVGSRDQIAATRQALLADAPAEEPAATFRELTMDLLDLIAGGEATGRQLRELNWRQTHGVQVIGFDRGGQRSITPRADTRLHAGDRVLVLGTPKQLARLRKALAPD